MVLKGKIVCYNTLIKQIEAFIEQNTFGNLQLKINSDDCLKYYNTRPIYWKNKVFQ